MTEKERVIRMLAILEMIHNAKRRKRFFNEYYLKQIEYPYSQAFLFRSKQETIDKIQFYRSVIERLWSYYYAQAELLTKKQLA